MRKKIYFVRHGQSESNASETVHGPDAPLTEKGRAQAAFMAERAQKLPAEVIVSSELPRARETAEIIAERTGLPLHLSNLFGEWRSPSQRVGHNRLSAFILEIDRAMQDNFGRDGWRHSDDENFDELKERAVRALRYIEERQEEHILVVTHAYFLRIIAALATFGPSMTSRECLSFIRAFDVENSGLSVFLYDSKEPIPWRIWVWNDHAHLG